jgi:hypothetical protein
MESPGTVFTDLITETCGLWSFYGLEHFNYSPLPSAGTHIRLLNLLPGSGPIHCALENVSLSDVVLDFTALSYRWGPRPLIPRTIVLHGRRQFVQRNLYAALVTLRKHGVQRLWIDALCINQNDLVEKEEQVRIMEEIYTRAKGVIVWLGDAQADSDYVMQTISLNNEQEYSKKRFLVGLLAILNREWFMRTWIVQEFVLNKAEPLIACGQGAMVPWNEFLAAYGKAFPFGMPQLILAYAMKLLIQMDPGKVIRITHGLKQIISKPSCRSCPTS